MTTKRIVVCLLFATFGFQWKLVDGDIFECSQPLGVESGDNAHIKASSEKLGNEASQVNLYSEKGWCAKDNDNSQYIEVNFGSVRIVTGVATRGHGTTESWVQTYKVEYSFDGQNYFEYKKRYDNTEQVFEGNKDNQTTVVNKIKDLAAQYIRIKPLSWTKSICMRLELLGCSADCDRWLGMAQEKGTPDIPDSALSASSSFGHDPWHNAQQARLFKERKISPSGAGAWVPYSQNSNEYIQVDLGRVTQVSGFVTMGRTSHSQWVKELYFSYSIDNSQWFDVQDGNSAKVFPGNINIVHLKINHLDTPVHARYVRFRARSWYAYIALRAEIIGCKKPGRKDLGMSSLQIPDNSITASTVHSHHFYPYYARLGLRFLGWASKVLSPNEYLQVYLGPSPVPVTGVAMQSRYDHDQCVKRFTLHVSNDSQSWTPYTTDDIEKVFDKDTDIDVIEQYTLNMFVLAKYVRFYIKSWRNYITMRVEVYGFSGATPQIFKRSPNNITVHEYEGVTLLCQTVGQGVITIKWYKGTTLLQTSSSTEKSDLVLGNLMSSDAGGYWCQATNSHGQTSYSLRINVEKRKESSIMCVDPEQLNDVTRRPENHVAVDESDETIIRPDKWYMFNTGYGKEVPEKCVEHGGCGAGVPGWLSGRTPTVEDGVIDTKICFRTASSCCGASAKVLVRRCYGYVVYKFYEGIPPSIGARVCVSKNVGSHPPAVPGILTVGNGYALTGFADAIHRDTPSLIRCTIFCINSQTCLSFNYSENELLCELSTTTKQKQPTGYGQRQGFRYYEKIISEQSSSILLV